MPAWDKARARAAIESLELDEANLSVANYWLSLWNEDGPPTRERFDPRSVVEHLPAIAMFEVMPDGPVICRLAGTFVQIALSHELTGHDLLEFTPEEEREQRIRQTRMIVDGSISFALRRFRGTFGAAVAVGEIALPFDGVTEAGGRRYLFHSAWRPGERTRFIAKGGVTAAGLATDQKILSICAD